MQRVEWKKWSVVLLCVCGGFLSDLWSASSPHIVVYLADDLGYGSVEPFGAPERFAATPRLNQLAADGIAFDQAYSSASVCSPTRYGLMTGRYSWRGALKRGVVNTRDALIIDPERATISRWLQSKGYLTSQFGKWHLGYKATDQGADGLLGLLKPGINDLGFHYSFAVPNNLDDSHKVYTENYGIFGLRSNVMTPYGISHYGRPYFGYDAPQRVTDEVMYETTQRAVDWIAGAQADRPLFMYFSSVAVHSPIRPSDRTIGRSEAGLYGDFIAEVDLSVGQIVDALKAKGIYDNTIFIFMSDNGGDIPPESQADKPERVAMAAGLDINGPLRGDKHTLWEGGLRVPTVISWPAQAPAGQRSDAFITTIDIFATVAEIVDGAAPPAAEAAPDSISFAHVLTNPAAQSRRFAGVFRDGNGRKALRMDHWKFIDGVMPVGTNKTIKVRDELYDLSDEAYERTDVMADQPSIAIEARDLLDDIINAAESRALCER